MGIFLNYGRRARSSVHKTTSNLYLCFEVCGLEFYKRKTPFTHGLGVVTGCLYDVYGTVLANC